MERNFRKLSQAKVLGRKIRQSRRVVVLVLLQRSGSAQNQQPAELHYLPVFAVRLCCMAFLFLINEVPTNLVSTQAV
jgi:hypothetical protein